MWRSITLSPAADSHHCETRSLCCVLDSKVEDVFWYSPICRSGRGSMKVRSSSPTACSDVTERAEMTPHWAGAFTGVPVSGGQLRRHSRQTGNPSPSLPPAPNFVTAQQPALLPNKLWIVPVHVCVRVCSESKRGEVHRSFPRWRGQVLGTGGAVWPGDVVRWWHTCAHSHMGVWLHTYTLRSYWPCVLTCNISPSTLSCFANLWVKTNQEWFSLCQSKHRKLSSVAE